MQDDPTGILRFLLGTIHLLTLALNVKKLDSDIKDKVSKKRP